MTLADNLSIASTPTDVDDILRQIYGAAFSERPPVSHITAVWRKPASRLRTIRINELAPNSPIDSLALNASRARADAIITTGKVLREEPDLEYTLHGPGRSLEALARWRTQKWGLNAPPWILVLTNARNLDLGHPVFHGWARPLIFTSDRGASRHLAHARCPVVADEAPSIRRAIQHLRHARQCVSISIESGPGTSLSLYEKPLVIDELLFSVFEDPSLPEQAQGDPFLDLDNLRRQFTHETSTTHEEPSGRWSFHRFT